MEDTFFVSLELPSVYDNYLTYNRDETVCLPLKGVGGIYYDVWYQTNQLELALASIS